MYDTEPRTTVFELPSVQTKPGEPFESCSVRIKQEMRGNFASIEVWQRQGNRETLLVDGTGNRWALLFHERETARELLAAAKDLRTGMAQLCELADRLRRAGHVFRDVAEQLARFSLRGALFGPRPAAKIDAEFDV